MSKEEKTFTPEQEAVTVPFFLHENEMTRLERLNKRWFIAFLVAIIMLFVSNAGWIIYESQFETYYYSQEAQTENAPAVTLLNTGEGDINYDQGKTGTAGTGEESQPEQPHETMPPV